MSMAFCDSLTFNCQYNFCLPLHFLPKQEISDSTVYSSLPTGSSVCNEKSPKLESTLDVDLFSKNVTN